MKTNFTTFLLLTFSICFGQNLVPNGDFEQYSGCPTGFSQIDSCVFWMNPSIGVNAGSPDYYNQCALPSSSVGVPSNISGYQNANSGNAYCGIYLWSLLINNVREYIEVPLTSTLIANSLYHFEMYVNLQNKSRYATDDLGVYFSDTAVTGIANYFPLPFTPQISNASGFITDTLQWTLISGNYTATGGENFLIIGNFKNDANTDTLIVNSNADFDFSYVFIEDVSLSLYSDIDEQNQNDPIKIYPNPFSDQCTVQLSDKEQTTVLLYDFLGQQVFQKRFTNTTTINTEQMKDGIYFYELRNSKGTIKIGKVVKNGN